MLSHGEQQNDVQYDYLIQEINPNLTDQNHDEHHDRTSVKSQKVYHVHQFLALLAETDTDIFRNIISIPCMQAAKHTLQGRSSFHLQKRIATIEEIEKFIDTLFHFLMAGTYLFQRLELRTFILADEIQMKCLVIVRDIRLYQM